MWKLGHRLALLLVLLCLRHRLTEHLMSHGLHQLLLPAGHMLLLLESKRRRWRRRRRLGHHI